MINFFGETFAKVKCGRNLGKFWNLHLNFTKNSQLKSCHSFTSFKDLRDYEQIKKTLKSIKHKSLSLGDYRNENKPLLNAENVNTDPQSVEFEKKEKEKQEEKKDQNHSSSPYRKHKSKTK